MKLIAHRALTQGPDPLLENHPDQIQKALNLGFDCELDLWHIDHQFFLGHDQPQYPISESLLANPKIWIHAKNLDALHYLCLNTNKFHFFWHENDAFACTNKGFIWTYPGQLLTSMSICVMPEHQMPLKNIAKLTCYGICSDYIQQIKELR